MRRSGQTQEWKPKTDEKLLIIHADDFGMCHSKNRATIRAFETGAISSASIMMPCAWVAEAVEWVKRNPNADVGLHLTLTSEWSPIRWRPVAPADKVKGLLDPQGYMWRSVEEVIRHATPQEVETEIRAQIELALKMGLKPTHLDSHMGTLYADARFFEVFLRVAIEYKIPPMVFSPTPEILLMAQARGIDYREVYQRILAAGLPTIDYLNAQYAPGESKDKHRQRLHEYLRTLKPGVNELIVHLGMDDPEGNAVTGGWRYRVQELEILQEPEFRNLLQEHKIRLFTYRELAKMPTSRA
ncbi:MAG: polysaccharide deacetylase family protein [Fimbriimonadales bacterium]|nr:polysaccharide deacetylase family protein [Fimbriimonadales bacterium]